MPSSGRFPVRRRNKIVFAAFVASLLVALVRINISMIVRRNEEGAAEFTISFYGPTENRYDARASPQPLPSVSDPAVTNTTIDWSQAKNNNSSNNSKKNNEQSGGGGATKKNSDTKPASTTPSSENRTETKLSETIETKMSEQNTKPATPSSIVETETQNGTKFIVKGKLKQKDMPLEKDILIEDGPVFEAPIINPDTRDFDPSINGVIVTKIHGIEHEFRALRQMLCLLTKAYNDRVHHDIIVFTSEPVEEEVVLSLQALVHPANLKVAVDNPGLHEMVDDLSPERRQRLLDRCNVTTTNELRWRTKCEEQTTSKTTNEIISYTWQAEFRALWIWKHPLLESYKYMMWLDADAFCTRTWKQDPLAAMERHDLALLFANFPKGLAKGPEFPRLTKQVFDRVICGIESENGTLVAKDGRCINRKKHGLKNVHGFFHVSSLDFYRSEAAFNFSKAMIGDNKFSRFYDDQIGITIPAAVLAGNRSRGMGSMGIYPRVYHNYFLDGRHPNWRGNFISWWERNSRDIFPEADGKCEVTIGS